MTVAPGVRVCFGCGSFSEQGYIMAYLFRRAVLRRPKKVLTAKTISCPKGESRSLGIRVQGFGLMDLSIGVFKVQGACIEGRLQTPVGGTPFPSYLGWVL